MNAPTASTRILEWILLSLGSIQNICRQKTRTKEKFDAFMLDIDSYRLAYHQPLKKTCRSKL